MAKANGVAGRIMAMLLLVMVLAVAGAAQRGKMAGGPPDRAQMQAQWDAWATLNADNAAKYYAKDADLVFYDFAGPQKYTGWEAYKRGAGEVLKTLKSGTFKIADDAKTVRRGNFAYGTATWTMDAVTTDGGSMKASGRWTVVYEKRGGQWLVVHEHVSVDPK